jgi:hypothetical protein
MNAETVSLINALETMRIPELQAKYQEVLGEPTRCPNRVFLVRRISESLAANNDHSSTEAQSVPANENSDSLGVPPIADVTDFAQTDENDTLTEDVPDNAPTSPEPSAIPDSTPTVPNAEPVQPEPVTQARGRFGAMSIDELQRMYVTVVGRSSQSKHRRYLEWKIREAEKGRITVGPRNAGRLPTITADAKVLPLRLEASVLRQIDSTWRARGIKSRMEFLRLAIGHYLEHLDASFACGASGI